MKLGAKGCINRNEFQHWGMLPHWKDEAGYAKWLKGVRSFGAKIWEVLGEKRAPNIVFEHPGESTIPTSIFVCDTGGMVAVCAGTTGYNATVDLRYLWMRQKRLQGSHFANTVQSNEMNKLALSGLLNPCLSRAFTYDDLPLAHQLMYENKHPHGNMAVLVGAREFGLGVSGKPPTAAEHPVVPKDDVHTTPHPYPMSVPLPTIAEAEPVMIVDDGAKVGDLMHRGVIACTPAHSVGEVAKTLVDYDVHAVVVLEGGKAVGVVSQTDLVLARQGRTADEAKAMLARDVMTPGCATCDKDMLLSDAVSLMTGRRVHRLVVTEDDRPIGVISMTDVVHRLLAD
jgi:crotonyl-CoA carboxylase/reductase